MTQIASLPPLYPTDVDTTRRPWRRQSGCVCAVPIRPGYPSKNFPRENTWVNVCSQFIQTFSALENNSGILEKTLVTGNFSR